MLQNHVLNGSGIISSILVITTYKLLPALPQKYSSLVLAFVMLKVIYWQLCSERMKYLPAFAIKDSA